MRSVHGQGLTKHRQDHRDVDVPIGQSSRFRRKKSGSLLCYYYKPLHVLQTRQQFCPVMIVYLWWTGQFRTTVNILVVIVCTRYWREIGLWQFTFVHKSNLQLPNYIIFILDYCGVNDLGKGIARLWPTTIWGLRWMVSVRMLGSRMTRHELGMHYYTELSYGCSLKYLFPEEIALYCTVQSSPKPSAQHRLLALGRTFFVVHSAAVPNRICARFRCR